MRYEILHHLLFLQNATLVHVMQDGLQPVHLAASCGHLDILRYFSVLPGIDFSAPILHEVNIVKDTQSWLNSKGCAF